MKILVFISLAMLNLNTFGQNDFFSSVNSFLDAYVKGGRVDYGEIANKKGHLQILVTKIADYEAVEMNNDTTKAFFINAYNILVIHQVIEHFPVNSPKDIPGFFDRNTFNVAGISTTLNNLEKGILMRRFPDPRLHFVLVCGALGCPPITNFAYRPQILDEQLDYQTELSMNDDDFIRSEPEFIKISEIFKWYQEDFLTEHSTVRNYISSYRHTPLEKEKKIQYYPYNWKLNSVPNEGISEGENLSIRSPNVFTFTPSTLLKKGQIEAQLFNNLYTQTAYRDGNREKIELDTRDSYYTALFYTLFGVSKSRRINIGFDANVKSVLIDSAQGNPLNVFRFENSPVSRTALTSLGPKIKFQPFKKLPTFSVQSAFWFPIADDLESVKTESDYPWLDYDMFTWWNQFFFDNTFASNWQVFAEIDLLFRFNNGQGNIPSHLETPVSTFVSWFVGQNLTIYYQIQYSPRFQLQASDDGSSDDPQNVVDPFDLIADFAHTGFGFKYQVTKNLNLEASSTYFFTSKNGGAGWTYNIGVRIIR